MTALWITIAAVALASAAIKAFGSTVVGGRELPASMVGVIALLVPSLLTALLVTQTLGGDGRLVLDEKAVGVAVALRAPVLVAVALAVVATVAARTFI